MATKKREQRKVTASTKSGLESVALSQYRRKSLPNPVAGIDRMHLGPITVEIEWDEDARSFSSYCPELEIASSGYTRSGALTNIKEAIRGHLETSAKLGLRLPLAAAQRRELQQVLWRVSKQGIPVLKPTEVEAALLAAGFEFVRSTGSHRHYAKKGHPTLVTVSFHTGDVPKRTLKSILKQAGLSVDDVR